MSLGRFELLEQRGRSNKIPSLQTFREPTVDIAEQPPRLLGFSLPMPQAGEACGCAQLQRLLSAAARQLERNPQALLSCVRSARSSPQQQFTFDPVNLGGAECIPIGRTDSCQRPEAILRMTGIEAQFGEHAEYCNVNPDRRARS